MKGSVALKRGQVTIWGLKRPERGGLYRKERKDWGVYAGGVHTGSNNKKGPCLRKGGPTSKQGGGLEIGSRIRERNWRYCHVMEQTKRGKGGYRCGLKYKSDKSFSLHCRNGKYRIKGGDRIRGRGNLWGKSARVKGKMALLRGKRGSRDRSSEARGTEKGTGTCSLVHLQKKNLPL